jgi:transcriptional regulator with XRE-family HTH domain
MSIGDKIRSYRRSKDLTTREFGELIGYDYSTVSRYENGTRVWQESSDAQLAAVSWQFALALADERTHGFIIDVLKYINLDLHPGNVKDMAMKELEEGLEALVEYRISGVYRKQTVNDQKVWQELKDAAIFALIMCGVIEERYTAAEIESWNRDYIERIKSGTF